MKDYFVGLVAAGVAVAAPLVAVAQSALPEIKRQASAQAVLDEHLDALNNCDWNRIVAQYPDDAQINLPGGTIVAGRKAIGELFAGFCKDSKDGGLKGLISRSSTARQSATPSQRSGSRRRTFLPSLIAARTPTSPRMG